MSVNLFQEAPNHDDLALSDLVIVAVEQFGAGPWATLQLADLGATVIKVEDPDAGGDVGRYVPPFADGQDSLYFESFNRGKLSVTLDISQPGGRETFEDLVAHADAVFCNLRGDTVEKLGLRYSDLERVNPQIVCCSLSGFGQTGPRRAEGAYDHTIQALAGWQSLTGDPSDPPTKSGLSLVDFMAGYVAAFSILAGVMRARRIGQGGDVDLSLFEIALAQLNYVGTWEASRGHHTSRTPRSSHPSLSPFGNFPTQDGWVTIACGKQSLWRRFCTATEQEDLISDPRFADFAQRARHRTELIELIDAVLTTRPSAEWLERFRAHGVPAAPINDVAAALDDPQVHARGGLQEVEHPVLGTVRHIPSPLRVPGGTVPARLAPRLGQDTARVLRELGVYDQTVIQAGTTRESADHALN